MTAGPDHAVDPLFQESIVQDPYPYFDDLRRADPVHEIVGTGSFLVTSMALVREVATRLDDFSSNNASFLHIDPSRMPIMAGYGVSDADAAAAGGGVLATADGAIHRRQRKVVMRKFSTAQMDAFESQFEALAEAALDWHLPSGRVEWMAEVADPLPNVVLARVLGLPDDTAPLLRSAGFGSVERINGFITPERSAEIDAAVGEAMTLVVSEYERAKRDPGPSDDSMLGILAAAVDAGELSDAEALGTMVLLISAGGESTSSLTGNAAHLLAIDKVSQDRLRQRPDLLPTYVDEALRIEPSFRGHYRVANRDTTIGSTTIPAGSRVILAWGAANHDPEAYEDPVRVDLDRVNPRNHVGFGWGVHLCVGAPLARVEARAALRVLLRRTTRFSLASDFEGPRYHKSLMIRRLIDLPLALELPRRAAP
jgi:cytochrome P450